MTAVEPIQDQGREAPVEARTWLGAIGDLLVLTLVPLMLLALALPPTRFAEAVKKQDAIFWWSIVIGCVSLVLWRFATPLFPGRRRVLPMILLGTSLLLLADITWNRRFTRYVATHHYVREVFRRKARGNTVWPVYGKYDNAFVRRPAHGKGHILQTLPWALASCLIAAGWFLWILKRPLERRWSARSFIALLLLQLMLITAFAACEPWPSRFSLQISGYLEFSRDLHRFRGIRDTLHHYVQRMPTLLWYGQHYPPGNLILIEIEKLLDLPGFTKAIVVLATALSALPLYWLGGELELDDRARSAALLLFTATTGVLIYCTINTTSLLLLPGTLCLWLLVRAIKTASIPSAAGLGICFAIYLFFSFSASILGVLMALTVALAWWKAKIPVRNILITGAVSLAALGGCLAALDLLGHFNLIACFATAVRGHETQQGTGGFDDPTRYLFRSTGNLIAYLMSTVPLCILALSAMGRSMLPRRDQPSSLAPAIFLAVGITILLASFSGLFYLETERIWIFLTPVLALAAGWELSRRSAPSSPDLIHFFFLLVLVISCTQEFFFQHYR